MSRRKRLIGSPRQFLNAAQLSRGWIKAAGGGPDGRLAAAKALGLVPARRGRDTESAASRAATRYLATGLVAAAVAAAIIAIMPAAHAQDAPTATQTPSAPASSAPSSSAPVSSSSTSGTAPASSATASGQASGGQSGGGKSNPVCFPLTGHCVDSSKAPATKAASGSAAAKSGATGKKPLNLTAPDVSTVVPEQQLKEPLPNTDQITETQEVDTVSVKGEQGVPTDVPLGLGSIWWAVSHPSQAWRILTPAE